MDTNEILMKIVSVYPDLTIWDDSPILTVTGLTLQFMGNLGKNMSDNEIDSFYGMVNSLCQTTDENVLGFVNVAILEVLTDTKISQEYAQIYLKGNAHDMFNKLFTHKFNKLTDLGW